MQRIDEIIEYHSRIQKESEVNEQLIFNRSWKLKQQSLAQAPKALEIDEGQLEANTTVTCSGTQGTQD